MTHGCYFGSGTRIFFLGGWGFVSPPVSQLFFQESHGVCEALLQRAISKTSTASIIIPLFNKHLTKHQMPPPHRGSRFAGAAPRSAHTHPFNLLLINLTAHPAWASEVGWLHNKSNLYSLLSTNVFLLSLLGSDPINLPRLLQPRQRNYSIILHLHTRSITASFGLEGRSAVSEG